MSQVSLLEVDERLGLGFGVTPESTFSVYLFSVGCHTKLLFSSGVDGQRWYNTVARKFPLVGKKKIRATIDGFEQRRRR